jgi:hypothetical protein
LDDKIGINEVLDLKDSQELKSKINYIQKDLKVYSLLLEQFSDTIRTIQVSLKEKDNITFKEKIQLVYEQ